MDIMDALKTRFTARAFKTAPIDRNMLEKVLEAALRAPSWGNTQPWKIYLASGEVLNRLREAYIANLKNCVARNPDLAAPKQWPLQLQKRMESLRSERLETLESVCLDKSELKDLSEMNYHVFHAPVVAIFAWIAHLLPGRYSTWDFFPKDSCWRPCTLASIQPQQ